jgi:hypothetical protein
MPSVTQFCHAQHVDLGLGNRNTKSNEYRHKLLDHIDKVLENESKPGFNGEHAVFELDDVEPSAAEGFLHPNWKLGKAWKPLELLQFGQENFGCDYFFWNYRRATGGNNNQFSWPDISPIIMDTQHFYLW